MKPVVLIFSAVAINFRGMKGPHVNMQICLYRFSSFILRVSCLRTYVSVSWNHVVDLYGQTILDFPPTFPVKKDALINTTPLCSQ